MADFMANEIESVEGIKQQQQQQLQMLYRSMQCGCS